MKYTLIQALIVTPFVLGQGSQLSTRDSCSADFDICAPDGAKVNTLGPISDGWGELFTDIVKVVGDWSLSAVGYKGHPPTSARRDTAFCCSNAATCLLVPTYNIPMCWDRFTTNVFFPDGTYGTVVSGDFNTSKGDSINLVYGDYTLKDGTKGNIYSKDGKTTKGPNTSTMTMPEQWTSSGQGSAIPATELGTVGSLSVITTVISATTIEPSTADSITIIATMTGCNHCPEYNTTIAGPTQPGTTLDETTSTLTTGIITPTITGLSKASHCSTDMFYLAVFSLAAILHLTIL